MSAFFSGSETALTGASSVRMHSKEKEGDKRAALVNSIRRKKDRMIGAILLGNNLVNILASALATSFLIKVFGEAGIVYATLIMTMLVLIFAEVLPKTYALHHPETLAMRIAPVMKFVIMILAPVTETVTWIVRMVLKMIGIDISKVTAGSHLELLRGVIDMHKGPEQETVEQRNMLRSILDLADVDIEEVLTHRKKVMMINADKPVDEIIDTVLSSPHTRLPVWQDDQDNIVGILHAKLLLRELSKCRNDVTRISLDDIMLEPRFVPETASLYDQLQAFRENQEHFAIVVDEYGTFMGIVTLEDILEEIVGEIVDEIDTPQQQFKLNSQNKIIAEGNQNVKDLYKKFNLELPNIESSTIGGYIMDLAKKIPLYGEIINDKYFNYKVISHSRKQILRVEISQIN